VISTGDLAAMRGTLTASLPDTAVIKRDTQVSDSAGGYTVTTVDLATVACRVAPSTGREQSIAGRLDAVGTWTLTLPAGTDVTAADRIAVGARTFEVVLPLAPRSWEIGRRIVCLEIL
jgi:SPP1 family predicted phage head-tail adaptor